MALFLFALLALSLSAATVPTAQYNNARTGANSEETILNPRNVAPATFGRVLTIPLDGDVFAQPLYVGGTVYAATEHNTVYAIDPATGVFRWHRNFGAPVPERVTEEIDPANGAEKPGSPVLIRATSREASFHSVREDQRAPLLLDRGTVYIAWASSCDVHPYYGWVLGYDARTLKPTGIFNAAPDSGESGIWQSDGGIAADENGNVYAVTGNGKFTAAKGGLDYGDSVLRLRFGSGPNPVQDYFTPCNQSELNGRDDDLGAGGPVLLPDHLIVVEGKSGVLYLIDRRRMGGFHAGSDNVVQSVLRDFTFANGKLSAAPAHSGSLKSGPGESSVVSANGAKDGIVWVVFTKAWNERTGEATLHAFDDANIGRMLFSADAGPAVRLTMPTVADGTKK